MEVVVTACGDVLLSSDVVILPGVGAFGDAMATLRRLDLVHVLRDIAVSDKPLIGICLGIQLLMSESHEFGVHRGLGVIEGGVVRLAAARQGARDIKVPQVQWNRIFRPDDGRPPALDHRPEADDHNDQVDDHDRLDDLLVGVLRAAREAPQLDLLDHLRRPGRVPRLRDHVNPMDGNEVVVVPSAVLAGPLRHRVEP